MPVEIVIPKLGMTMEEGTLTDWLVPDGAEVEAGTPVFNLETEKIQMEVEAEASGTVRHIVAAGTTLPPGAVVGYILAAGEKLPTGAPVPEVTSPSALAPEKPAPANGVMRLEEGRIPATPIARRLAKEAGLDISIIRGTGPGGRIVEADIVAARERPQPPAARPEAVDGHVLASPIARRLAESLNVSLAGVRGTGPGGRITKEDVEAAAAGGKAATPAAVPAAQVEHQPGSQIPVRGMRKVIARRMHESLQQMAQLTMGAKVDMAEAMKLRTQLVDEWAPDNVRPTYTDLVLRAVAKALRSHPRMNAEFTDKAILLSPEVHVGLAVALEDGLVVPVIRNADQLTLKAIASESSRLAMAARENKLLPDDMTGQTFSITALGAAGVDFFTPIINPPNAGILGVGQIHDGLRWTDEQPVRTPVMTLSLTFDHRAIDGAPAAAFLGTVRELLEAPYRLLV